MSDYLKSQVKLEIIKEHQAEYEEFLKAEGLQDDKSGRGWNPCRFLFFQVLKPNRHGETAREIKSLFNTRILESGRIELPSENHSPRLSTRLVIRYGLKPSPSCRYKWQNRHSAALWYVLSYKALT